ncbi:MAG TPA: DUF6074 family protein [Bryobacteraceae bacterium]|jgi:hypothetical protein
MTAQIYVFPLERRVGYIRDKAAKLLNRRDRTDADRYLDGTVLACSADSLLRLGFSNEEICVQLTALRAAIIAESWRVVMTSAQASAESA